MTSSTTRPNAHKRPTSPGAQSTTTGRLGEELAEAHLQRLGYRILARNARSAAGEIDLIAHGFDTIVFVEVKTRRLSRRRRERLTEAVPLERLGASQRLRLRREAAAWLARSAGSRPRVGSVRFDAIGVVLAPSGALLRLDHVESAW